MLSSFREFMHRPPKGHYSNPIPLLNRKIIPIKPDSSSPLPEFIFTFLSRLPSTLVIKIYSLNRK